MISETYKILSGMYALENFDVESLVNYSGVKENTVRTTLLRHREFFDEIGRKKTGKPGGQDKIYRLKPRAASKIRKSLEEYYTTLAPIINKRTPPLKINVKESDFLSFQVAKDILDRLYHKAKTIEEKKTLLSNAAMSLNMAKDELGIPDNPEELTTREQWHIYKMHADYSKRLKEYKEQLTDILIIRGKEDVGVDKVAKKLLRTIKSTFVERNSRIIKLEELKSGNILRDSLGISFLFLIVDSKWENAGTIFSTTHMIKSKLPQKNSPPFFVMDIHRNQNFIDNVMREGAYYVVESINESSLSGFLKKFSTISSQRQLAHIADKG